MRRLLWMMLCSCVCSLQLGCPGGSGGSDAGRFELEGTWSEPNGTIVVIEGSTGRLAAFPLGPVLGRDIFDVDDEYLRAIESVGDNRYEAELAQLQNGAAGEGLSIEAVSYARCTLELSSESALQLTREDGTTEYLSRIDHAVAPRRSGACEGKLWSVSANGYYYLCSDAYTKQECSYEALGKSSLFSELAYFEFSEGKTCPELGYADRFDEPALYQFAAGDNATPGPSGHWGSLVASDAQTPDPEDAGVSDDGGVIEPAPDAAVDGSQYLVFGTAWDHASIDCPEGSATFDDWRAYAFQVVDGEWSDTYDQARAEIETKLMTDAPGARAYYVESSWFEYGREASHAVIIEYVQALLAWDCRPHLVTIGYGKSYEEALAQALETKANNDSESAPYTELDHVTWQP